MNDDKQVQSNMPHKHDLSKATVLKGVFYFRLQLVSIGYYSRVHCID